MSLCRDIRPEQAFSAAAGHVGQLPGTAASLFRPAGAGIIRPATAGRTRATIWRRWDRAFSSSTTTPASAGTRVGSLECEGYEVVGEADDCMSGLDAAREIEPELVLVDVYLPDADGFELADRLRGPPVPAAR